MGAKLIEARRPRLSAALGHQVKTIGPTEAHERNVLAITRTIHRLAGRKRELRKQAAAVDIELKAKRRELRAVLQRDGMGIADPPETPR